METERGGRAHTLIQAFLSWPVFAILVVLVFWKPLHQVGELIPRVIENSETITLGKIVLSTRQTLKSLGDKAGAEVRDALSGMEAEDVMTMLESKLVNKTFYSGDVDDDVRKWQRLKRLGVVVELSGADLRKAEKEDKEKAGYYAYGIAPTAKYDKVRKFLSTALLEVVSASVQFRQESQGKAP